MQWMMSALVLALALSCVTSKTFLVQTKDSGKAKAVPHQRHAKDYSRGLDYSSSRDYSGAQDYAGAAHDYAGAQDYTGAQDYAGAQHDYAGVVDPATLGEDYYRRRQSRAQDYSSVAEGSDYSDGKATKRTSCKAAESLCKGKCIPKGQKC